MIGGTIGIVDYGMGNLRSVQKAIQRAGGEAQVLTDPAQAAQADKLILPGVGSFADAMDNLQAGGWVGALRDFAVSGRPMLGVCLGMQLMLGGSEEEAPPGKTLPGLGLFKGTVRLLRVDAEPYRLKVPHMGWNRLRWERRDPLLAGLEQGDAVYFVHGYAAPPNVPDASALCDYGQPICATLWRDNLWATQFHPEKSQAVGLKLLGNFVAL